MYWNLLATLSVLALGSLAQETLEDVKNRFAEFNIVDDLAIKFEPKVLLKVTLPQTDGSSLSVNAGQQVPRDATAGPPAYSIAAPRGGWHDDEKNYVLITVDPDAPTPQNPTSSQIRHFLGANFNEVGGALVNKTAAISEWRQPTPPAGSDAHRYIFLLFEQPDSFNNQTLINSTSPITLFNVSSFAEQTSLGDPIAGTFLLVAPAA